MNVEHLVKMVNEISAFFVGDVGAEQASSLVAGHLKRYWEPRMREQIVAHYQQGAGGLCDVGRQAVALLAHPPGV